MKTAIASSLKFASYIFSAALLSSIAAPAFADSPCDGLNLSIINHTGSVLTVMNIETYKESTVNPLSVSTEISPEQKLTTQIYSGSGSWGNAKGKIILSAENHPESPITLIYSCVKLFPQVPIIGDPDGLAMEPYHVEPDLNGSTSVFEVYGP